MEGGHTQRTAADLGVLAACLYSRQRLVGDNPSHDSKSRSGYARLDQGEARRSWLRHDLEVRAARADLWITPMEDLAQPAVIAPTRPAGQLRRMVLAAGNVSQPRQVNAERTASLACECAHGTGAAAVSVAAKAARRIHPAAQTWCSTDCKRRSCASNSRSIAATRLLSRAVCRFFFMVKIAPSFGPCLLHLEQTLGQLSRPIYLRRAEAPTTSAVAATQFIPARPVIVIVRWGVASIAHLIRSRSP